MGKLKTLISLCKSGSGVGKAIMANFTRMSVSHLVSDRTYLKLQYRACVGKKLNLNRPTGFNEKLQWLKLYDRNTDYIRMVDKCDVKEYVANAIGDEYIIPTLAVWERAEDITIDELPEQFVLKCTHDSGSVVICKNKADFDLEKAKAQLAIALQKNMFWHGREWPYKNVKPRIIAEQYMSDDSGELSDYKFMCFNGTVKCSFVCTERFSGKGLHVTFLDKDWKVMPFERSFPSVKEGLPKPLNYEKMVELAEKLSAGIPFVRVDFYEVDNQIYFGELTFFPGNGTETFQPKEWDDILGSWIELPTKETRKRKS